VSSSHPFPSLHGGHSEGGGRWGGGGKNQRGPLTTNNFTKIINKGAEDYVVYQHWARKVSQWKKEWLKGLEEAGG